MGQDEARSITKITAEHEASEDPASTVSEKSIACAANSVPILAATATVPPAAPRIWMWLPLPCPHAVLLGFCIST